MLGAELLSLPTAPVAETLTVCTLNDAGVVGVVVAFVLRESPQPTPGPTREATNRSHWPDGFVRKTANGKGRSFEIIGRVVLSKSSISLD
jgi:hypothetical protein